MFRFPEMGTLVVDMIEKKYNWEKTKLIHFNLVLLFAFLYLCEKVNKHLKIQQQEGTGMHILFALPWINELHAPKYSMNDVLIFQSYKHLKVRKCNSDVHAIF